MNNNVRSKIGVKTRNPFFNFLREFRMQTNERKMSLISQKAAIKWRTMTEVQKMPYIMMARDQPMRLKQTTQLKRTSTQKTSIVDWKSVTYVN